MFGARSSASATRPAGIPSGPFADKATFRTWLKDRASRDGQVLYAIRDKKSGKSVGLYFLLRIDPQAAACEIGLVYGKALQRTPAGTVSRAGTTLTT